MKTKVRLIASVKIWIAIYPSITVFLYMFSRYLSALPLYQRTLILTSVLVPWVIFVGVPFLESVAQRFKIHDKTHDLTKQ